MKKDALKSSFVVGSIALVFLIVGYQVAVFVHSAAVAKIAADRDCPDTVFVVVGDESGKLHARHKDGKRKDAECLFAWQGCRRESH